MRSFVLSTLIVIALANPCAANPPDDVKGTVEEAVENGQTGDFPRIEGKTEAEVLAALGEPDERRDFQMKDCCHEFEIELYNTYSPDEPEHGDVEIHERHWHFDDYILTVWFHQVEGEWTALDTHLWQEDTEF